MISNYSITFPETIENCSKIRAFIDHAYNVKTYKYQVALFIFWLLLLVVPFFAQQFWVQDGNLSVMLLILVFISATLLISLEVIQFRQKGFWKYFSDGWNYFDIFQYTTFICLFITRLIFNELENTNVNNVLYEKHNRAVDIVHPNASEKLCAKDYSLCEISPGYKWILLWNSLIICTMLIKLLLFMRVFQQTQLMTVLIWKVTADMTYMLLFFIIWVIFFAVQGVVLISNPNNTEALTYVGTSKIFGYFMDAFENGLGQVTMPSMDYWKNNDKLFVDKIIIGITWAFYIIQQVFLLIILLNFVIAKVGASYQEIMDEHVMHQYQMKQELNEDCDVFYEFINNYFGGESKEPINIVILMDTYQEDETEWKGITQTLKRSIKASNKDITEKIEVTNQKIDHLTKMMQTIFKGQVGQPN